MLDLVQEENNYVNKQKPNIANELPVDDDKVAQRVSMKATTPVKFKQYVDEMTGTPEGRASLAALRTSYRGNPNQKERSTSPFNAKSPLEAGRKSQLGKSKTRMDRHLLKSSAVPEYEDDPDAGRVSRKSSTGKRWTIPKKYDDSDNDDEDDNRGIFCGICVSKRSKNKGKNAKK